MATEDRFFNTEEVAEMLQVDEQTIRRWIKAGKLRAFKPGREWKIPQSALDSLQENYSAPKALRNTRTGDDRLRDRIAPRIERLERENPGEEELTRRVVELESQLSDLKEDVPYQGGTRQVITDHPAYMETTDELFAVMLVLDRIRGRAKV
ncbi:MAG: helix-turn-helix domain-containing protein [Actinomycetota bacterium]|nr:helix-turn-helix domain-containing protein [Actinomycetota bacterium]